MYENEPTPPVIRTRGYKMTKEQAERIKIQADNFGYTDILILTSHDGYKLTMTDNQGRRIVFFTPSDWEARKEVQ